MKRRRFLTLTLTLMISLLLLCSCSSEEKDIDRVTEFRAQAAEAPQINVEADITAHHGSKLAKYTLSYTEEGDEGQIEVLAPEILSGVSARINAQDLSVEYDGLILETGKLNSLGLTPISSLPAAVQSIKSGHLEGVWRETRDEREMIVAEITISDSSKQIIWLDRENLTPAYLEISEDGSTVLTCDIKSWS